MSLDKNFVKRLQKQDRQAFGELYAQTVDQLYRYLQGRYSLTKQEMQDLISDFYLKLWRVMDKYNDDYKFESFFWTVFKNLVKDYFKGQRHVYKDHDILETKDMSDPDAMLKSIQGSFQMASIQKAMKELDDMSYQIIIMRYVEQRSYEEISEAVSMNPDTVRQRLSRAIRRIKDLLT